MDHNLTGPEDWPPGSDDWGGMAMIRSAQAHEDCRRGTTRLVHGDRDGAPADFDRALEADPDYPEAYNNRGVARHGLGDPVGDLADFDRARELAPRYAEAY